MNNVQGFFFKMIEVCSSTTIGLDISGLLSLHSEGYDARKEEDVREIHSSGRGIRLASRNSKK